MKIKHFLTVAMLLAMTPRSYGSETFFLSKTYRPNLWQPLHPYFRCEVFSDKIVISRAIGIDRRLETFETRQLELAEGTLARAEEAIALANQGQIEPGEIESLNTPLMTYETAHHLLLRKAFIGQWKTERVNMAKEAGLLVGFLDEHCPDK